MSIRIICSLMALAVIGSSFGQTADAQDLRQMGTRRGALAGAVIGGIIGSQNDEAFAGAVVGGLVGGATGRVIGNRAEQNYYGGTVVQEQVYVPQQRVYHQPQVFASPSNQVFYQPTRIYHSGNVHRGNCNGTPVYSSGFGRPVYRQGGTYQYRYGR